MTHLRKMMLEELQRRHYSEATTQRYIRFIEPVAQHFHSSPDRLGPRRIREYQAQLFTVHKLTPGSVTNHLCALRFLYIQTLKRPWSIADTPYPKKRYSHRSPIPSSSLPGCVRSSAKIGSSTPNHPSADPSMSCSISAAIPTASPSPTIAWSHWRMARLPFAGVTLPTTIGRN